MSCVFVAVALMTLCFSSEEIKLPPAQYDHPYMGKTRISRHLSEDVVNRKCDTDKNNPVYGCAWVLDGICNIIVIDRKVIGDRNFKRLMRHETAHCNGWGPDHEGARD